MSIDEIGTLKKHIFFGKHQLPMDGGKGFFRRRFSAHSEIAYALQKAQKGLLSTEEQKWFKQLLDHELGERKFMAKGIPYRQLDSWDEALEMFTNVPPGAHDLAPPHAPFGTFPRFWDWYVGQGF